MTYQAHTIKDMLGALYDLVGIHGSEADITAEQKATIRRLYAEVKPNEQIERLFKEQEVHAGR